MKRRILTTVVLLLGLYLVLASRSVQADTAISHDPLLVGGGGLTAQLCTDVQHLTSPGGGNNYPYAGQFCADNGTVYLYGPLTYTPTYTPTFTLTPTQTGTITTTPTPLPTTTPASIATPFPTATTIPSGRILTVGSPGGTYPSIAAALAAVQQGDTISLHAGSYPEQPDIRIGSVSLAAFGDGSVWIDGGCQRAHGITISANNVTVSGIGIKQTTDSAIMIDGYNNPFSPAFATIDGTTIQDYNCTDAGLQASAGIAAYYAGSGHRVTNNTITRRVEIAGPQAGQGNGVWFKSSTSRPSGGGHYIAGNVITGGYDGIGGETETDAHGAYDKNSLIERNQINHCGDDGIQIDGGGQNVTVQDNVITECGGGVSFAAVLTGPARVQRNTITSATLGILGQLHCFKYGHNGFGSTVYLTDNVCTVNGGAGSNLGKGVQQTNPNGNVLIASGNRFTVSAYVYEFTSGPTVGSKLDNDCMETSDPTRFIKWNNAQYQTLAAFRAAVPGQETYGRLGPCGSPGAPTPTTTPIVAAGPTPVPGDSMTTRLSDTFTDTNGVLLESHAMDVGSGWTEQAAVGGFTILSNQVIAIAATANDVATADAGVADNLTISIDIGVPNSINYAIGLALRYPDFNNGWIVVIERDAGGTPYLAIVERVSGTNTIKASTNFASSPTNTTQSPIVTLAGSVITATAGTTSVSYSSATSNQTDTHMGLFQFTGGGYSAALMDNFLVVDTVAAVKAPQDPSPVWAGSKRGKAMIGR